MYGSVADMIGRFGAAELIRLTTVSGTPADTLDAAKVNRALDDASALIDSFVRRRYKTPLSPVPAEVSRAAAILARFDLSTSEDATPSETAKDMRKEVLEWLNRLRDGTVLLDAAENVSGDESYATMQERIPVFGHDIDKSGFF